MARGPDDAALTVNPNTLCNPCVGQLQHQYDELPKIRDALHKWFMGGMSSTSNHVTKVGGTPGRLTPLNVTVLDLIDDIDTVLDRCGNLRIDNLIYQSAREFTVWRSGKPRQEWLDGIDLVLQIRTVCKRSDSVIKLSRAVTARISPCPKCNLRTLVSVAGTESVTCSNCGGVMTFDEYKRIVLVRAENQKKKGIN